jgi:hypothetical protein
LETRGEHTDFLEALLKILALAPPHSCKQPWLDKLMGMFGDC